MGNALVFVLAAGFVLMACGGSDFVAATDTPEDGSTWHDSTTHVEDRGTTTKDAPMADAGSHGDDGVPDANGERVVADATAVDTGVNDTTPERSIGDATFDATAEASAADIRADVTCDAPLSFYRDRDRDGFGSTDNRIMACLAPADDDGGTWVTQPGDCRDDLAEVKPFKAGSPDPPKYSGTGYPDPVRPRGISFDYDCNGDETGDPSNQFGVAPTCPNLGGGNCNGTGYVAASPGRSGTGINPFCGSTTLKSCVTMGLNCVEQYIQMATPFRCR
jgi:hypothetical protein